MERKLIVAHRGASNLAPENTLAAFSKAMELGADMIELDVRKTKDDVLVVVHDPDYKSKQIRNLTYGQLSELSQNQIPTLKETLDLCPGKIKLNVELKESGDEKLVGEILTNNFDVRDLVVTSFIPEAVIELKHLYPQIRIGLVVGAWVDNFWNILRLMFLPGFSRQFDDLSLSYRLRRIWKLLHLSNRRVWVWTVDDLKMIKELSLLPEVTGIVTNKPDLAIKILNYGNPQ